MRIKVEEKLMRMAAMFVGQKLKNIVLKEHKIDDKEILTMELLFSNEGISNTMLLILDKNLTESGYKKIAKKLCQ